MVITQRRPAHASLETTETGLSHIAHKLVIDTMARREWSPWENHSKPQPEPDGSPRDRPGCA